MHQHPITLLNSIRLSSKRERRKALREARCGYARRDSGREGNREVPGDGYVGLEEAGSGLRRVVKKASWTRGGRGTYAHRLGHSDDLGANTESALDIGWILEDGRGRRERDDRARDFCADRAGEEGDRKVAQAEIDVDLSPQQGEASQILRP